MPWQEFQDVVRTMVWDDVAADLNGEKLGEIEDDIHEIRKLLDDS